MSVSPTIAFLILSILTIIWVVILIPVLRDMIKLKRLRKNGEIVYGRIIKYTVKKDSDGDMYTPIIEFKASNNQMFTYISKWDQSSNIPIIGEEVALLYDKDDPRQVIKYDTSIYSKGLFLNLFIGCVILMIWIGAINERFKLSSSN